MERKIISVVTPCYNEGSAVIKCYKMLKRIFEEQLPHYKLEHIFCDNASTDDTVEHLRSIASVDKNVKVIINSRNFGILKNTFNGVLNSSGDATILFMPVDLQDPPELIPQFVLKWEQGYEIVYGIREKREENFLLAKARKLYYRLLRLVTYVAYPLDVGDFQLIDRCVLDAMKKVDDANPFMRLMTFDCGFNTVGIKYTWRKRETGKSKNSIIKMFGQGLTGIVSYSGAPLRLALILGCVISVLSLCYAFTILILTLLGLTHGGAGIPTIIIALFFFSGVQLFFLGMLGEYIFAIFNQVRKKPLIIERERINFCEKPHEKNGNKIFVE